MTETTAAPKKKVRGKARKDDTPTPLHAFQGTKKEQLQQLYNQWFGCTRCTLCTLKTDPTKSDIVFGEGNPDTADILIIGEAPGEEEEATSVPFVGNSGQLLNQILAMTSDDPAIRAFYEQYSKMPRTGKKGEEAKNHFHKQIIDWRYERFFVTNAVACRPPENRTPFPDELKACRERLMNILYILDPLIVIACGNSALTTLFRSVSVKITQMRGNVYDGRFDGRFGTITYPVFPIYHPSYLLRKADWNSKNGDWAKTVDDVRKALRVADFLRHHYHGTPIPQR